MMGQEHISYLMGYGSYARIDYVCDPHEPSLERCLEVMRDFDRNRGGADGGGGGRAHQPILLRDEGELLKRVDDIDLLVIASPNYVHTDQILRWGRYDITILVEKPVAVSYEQHRRLTEFAKSGDCGARIWVAMEYRFIPAIAKLLDLIPSVVGDVKMVTIRENRYPFLHKIGRWNRDRAKTGDTLVEKCCHFFDLFRLITGQEADLARVRALAQRGLNYGDEVGPDDDVHEVPIIDSAYVFMPFEAPPVSSEEKKHDKVKTIGCLELCMYAEGSRHQEEITVTGTEGRLEAYLPENKVYSFRRPSHALWSDRSVPPPPASVERAVYDCSDVRGVHNITSDIPTHGGYHYSSTAVEWHYLFGAIRTYEDTGAWVPKVSLADGLHAVEIGLRATELLGCSFV